jgi:hypothetical protein
MLEFLKDTIWHCQMCRDISSFIGMFLMSFSGLIGFLILERFSKR